MDEWIRFFVNIWLKFFFLLTPPFVVSMFLAMTESYTEINRRKLALRVTLAICIICLVLFFFGKQIFFVFGISIDAFRVGAGALLFISSIGLVQAKDVSLNTTPDENIAVVPLALPLTVGPATIGALLILGAELSDTAEKIIGSFALIIAVISIGLILLFASFIERILHKKGITILSKITGLILAAIAAQMMLEGVRNFLTN